LNNYAKDEQFSSLISDFELIKGAFDGVSISYEIADPQTVEKDGMLMVVQEERSVVNIPDNVLKEIIGITKSVRDKRLREVKRGAGKLGSWEAGKSGS